MKDLEHDLDNLRKDLNRLMQSHIKLQNQIYIAEPEKIDEEDNWNLADTKIGGVWLKDDIKTFIQKVNEDINREEVGVNNVKGLIYPENVKMIIKKWTGDLK